VLLNSVGDPASFAATGLGAAFDLGARIFVKPGLLSAVCRWFADQGVSIEAADIETAHGTANDVFLVDGDCPIDDLFDLVRWAPTPT
jgi:hypothetical protein